MHAVSSITIAPQEPSNVPFDASESKSIRTSHSSGRRIGTDEPPGMTPLSLFPFRMPPHSTSINSISGTPSSRSITAGLLTCPLTQYNLGPVFFSLEPMLLYHSTPRLNIWGKLTSVSTLLTTVGQL